MLRRCALKPTRPLLRFGGSSLSFSLRVAAGKKERHGPCVRNITQSGTIQIKEAGHNRLLDFHCQIMIHRPKVELHD